jgi:hypothetical protein
MELASCQAYGAQNFEAASRFLEHLWALHMHYNTKLRICVIDRCITYTIAQSIDE